MDFTDWAITLLLIHLLGLAVAARYEDNDDRRRTRHRSTTKPSDPPDQGTPPVTKTLLVATAAAVALVYAGAAFFDRMQADAYQSAALRCAQVDPDLAPSQCEQFKTAAGQTQTQPKQE